MGEKVSLKTKLPNLFKFIDQAYEKDFTFIVDGYEFKINKIIADYISPTVFNIHKIDPTYDKLVLKTNNKNCNFRKFIQLIKKREITIDKSEISSYLDLIKALKIDYIKLIDETPNKVTLGNVFQNIKFHEKYEEFFSQKLEDEINFLAENFFRITDDQKNKMKKFSLNTLYRIFSNENFQISDEDEFLSFINKLYNDDHDKSYLYEFVQFSYVSQNYINEFFNTIELDDMNEGIWRSLCSFGKNKTETNEKVELNNDKGIKFAFKKENDFDGILNYLQNKNKNSFKIEAASHQTNSPNKKVENIVDYEKDEYYFYYSNSQYNNWIQIDFQNHSVKPTEYTIKSANWEKNGDHLKSWRIDASTDGESWETIDEVKDCANLNDRLAICTFKIKKDISNKFKMIRLVSVEPNWRKRDYLSIKSFELYGTLY